MTEIKVATPNPLPKPENPVLPQPKQLLGDRLEQVLDKVGVKKAAQVYQRITKRPCNCGRRKEVLNNMHRKIIRQPTQTTKS